MRRLTLVIAIVLLAGCSGSGSHPAATSTPKPVLLRPLTRASEQKLPATYTQGVARVDHGWIFSGNNSLWRTDEQFHVVQEGVRPVIPAAWAARGFSHLGDIDVVGNTIYAPFELSDYTKGTQAMARYDATTLAFIDAVVVSQHQNSFVTVDPATMIAYTMDQFDGNALLRYDVAHGWKPLPQLTMTVMLHKTQGADVANGAVWISTDDDTNGIYRVDLVTGQVDPAGTMGHLDGEGEGIDATALPSGLVHTLCVDAAITPVWFGHFRTATP